jgi:hypothetical protein
MLPGLGHETICNFTIAFSKPIGFRLNLKESTKVLDVKKFYCKGIF